MIWFKLIWINPPKILRDGLFNPLLSSMLIVVRDIETHIPIG